MTAAKTKAACIVVLAANGEAARMIAVPPAVPIVVGAAARGAREHGFAETSKSGRQVARQPMLTRGLVPTVVSVPEDTSARSRGITRRVKPRWRRRSA